MRLFRWLAYCLIGYCVYEFYQGLSNAPRSARRRSSSRRDLERALDSDQGRLATLTGPSIGQKVAVEDFDGASATRVVGRGVVRT